MKGRKGAIALAVLLVVVLMSIPVWAASEYQDTAGHWGEKAISTWSNYGVIQGADGQFRPNDGITRGEMAVILNRVMGYQKQASNSFTDLGQAFYTDAILKANAAGVIQGDGATVRPNDKITRQEAAVMLGRAFGIAESSSGASFSDSGSIASWAKGYVNAMASLGYINGRGDGTFGPKASISRAETVTILDNAIKGFYNKSGTYTQDVDGMVIISATGVTLDGAKVTGNVIVAEGATNGATLKDVTVSGETMVRGGGLDVTGKAQLGNVTVSASNATVKIADTATAGTVRVEASDVKVTAPDSVKVTAASDAKNVTVNGKAITKTDDTKKDEDKKESSGGSGGGGGGGGTVTPTQITLDKTTVDDLVVGQSVQLTASFTPSSNVNKSVAWTSSNTEVATVSGKGLVEAKSAGTATITVTSTKDTSVSAQCAVTVVAAPQDLTILTARTVQGGVYNDVTIGAAVDNGTVELKDVTILGNLVVKGGGSNSIILSGNTQVQGAVAMQKDSSDPESQVPSLKLAPTAQVKLVVADQAAIIEAIPDATKPVTVPQVQVNDANLTVKKVQVGSLNATGSDSASLTLGAGSQVGLVDASMPVEVQAGAQVTSLETTTDVSVASGGQVAQLNLANTSPATVTLTGDAKVGSVNVMDDATTPPTIQLAAEDGKQPVVEHVVAVSNAGVALAGTGTVKEVSATAAAQSNVTVTGSDLQNGAGTTLTQDQVKVKVALKSIDTPLQLTVPYGTDVKDLSLPQEVNVTLSNGETAKLQVANWTCASYNGNVPGDYLFTASWKDLGDYVDGGVFPVATVTVEDQETFAVTFKPAAEQQVSIVVKDATGAVVYPTSNPYVYELPAGTYTYTATMPGYEAKTGKVEVKAAGQEVAIEALTPKQATVTFSLTPKDAKLTVTKQSGEEVTANNDGTYTLESGAYHYVVSAKDYITEEKDFTVTVSDVNTGKKAITVKLNKVSSSSAKAITSFKIGDAVGTINEAKHTIAVEVAHDADLTQLTPTIAVSESAAVSPKSGVVQNFSSPVTYTVTAEDGSTQPYTVTVTQAAAPLAPIGSDAVSFAPLSDTRTEPDKIPDGDLISGYGASAALVSGRTDHYTVTVAGTGLKAHQNGKNAMGYWAGFSVKAPAEATQMKCAFAATAVEGTNLGELQALEENIQGGKGVAFYANLGDVSPKKYVALQWYDAAGEALSAVTYFTMDLKGVRTDLDKAEEWKTKFETALGSDAGKADMTWDTLITAVHYYQEAQADSKNAPEANQESITQRLAALTNYYASVTALNMSGKTESQYAISTGALIPFTGLETLNLSGVKLTEAGGLVDLTNLKTLNLSKNDGLNDEMFGALANMSNLTTLDLSGTTVTDLGGLAATGCASSLVNLDISGTKVAKLETVWTGSVAAFPALKRLTAQDLTLTSISGLVEIANSAGFNATGLTWDLSGSNLTSDAGGHVQQITNKFGQNGSFTPPTVPGA